MTTGVVTGAVVVVIIVVVWAGAVVVKIANDPSVVPDVFVATNST